MENDFSQPIQLQLNCEVYSIDKFITLIQTFSVKKFFISAIMDRHLTHVGGIIGGWLIIKLLSMKINLLLENGFLRIWSETETTKY